jgi:hypothetical protein
VSTKTGCNGEVCKTKLVSFGFVLHGDGGTFELEMLHEMSFTMALDILWCIFGNFYHSLSCCNRNNACLQLNVLQQIKSTKHSHHILITSKINIRFQNIIEVTTTIFAVALKEFALLNF